MPKLNRFGVRGLLQRADGRFVLFFQWRDPATSERRRYKEVLPAGTTAATAKDLARTRLNLALKGELRRDECTLTLPAALDKYLEWVRVNRPRTARNRASLNGVLARVLGTVRLDEVAPITLEKFKRDRLAEDPTPAPATVNRGLAQLKHAFGIFAAWGWVPQAQADALRRVKLLKEPPGRVRWLSADEAQQLANALAGRRYEHVRMIVDAAALTGMRLAELLTLRKDAVDLAAGTITLGITKNNKRRYVPITEPLAAVLTAAMARSPGVTVFTNRSRRPYRSGFGATFRGVITRAGLTDFHFHDMRHHAATTMRRHGVQLDVIAQQLGHSSLQMSARYAHIDNATQRAAASQLTPLPKADATRKPPAARHRLRALP